ncbi:MAG: SDR family NAD(P)-dependent oxidoreductase [Chloroflexota bacterium]
MNAPKVAVITGATQGIGLETARELSQRGYRVIVTGRDIDKAQKAAQELTGLPFALAHALDVGSDESVALFFDWLQTETGRIDVLVNNAGRVYGGNSGSFESTETTQLLDAFNNNAASAYRMAKLALPLMNQQGYGRIVNVSSGMGSLDEMGSGAIAYRVSKTAMNAITRLLAHEAREDVKVNAVCPGWVRTEMGGPSATRSVSEGATGVVWAATLPPDGPSSGFFRDGNRINW